MADHGGYRKPTHPAPVSGPGKYSRRTDGGPAQVMSAAPDQAYGAQKAQLDAQRVAPMAGTAPLPAPATPGAGSEGGMPAYSGPAFNAPSQRPDEPVTHGVDIGPGAGSDILGLPNPGQGTGQMTALLQRYASTDTTGILGTLFQAAQARNA